ncbi:transcriptional adaptor 2 [Dothidotthia symphoricarpi CBS 119687]|uniref:Transcriptional adapter 2 n=1 Tax=Dothidotthia symphoricarpi CBS 119687 TaxID=1392245 RepID=A0A6A6A0H3_9PLEO|nr:transcriptional adaptor 2 [Dothidotthia symphoricarpi CBS 119687]KAF2125026.1 transcriptional adaptor 2 [Dothidotthia symphoricarpi CBS 119687]
MGVIKKKTGTRGTEGGIKYICDVCSSDITSTVRIRCANDTCHEYDLCVPCFSDGKCSRDHNPATHPFKVIEQHSIPIYTEDWGADEELALLEGAETYGLGSWADIADHIGGFRERDEVRDHYIDTYVNSSRFPLPKHCSPDDTGLSDRIPREQFQSRKKQRIEKRKEAAAKAEPATPKQKPTASVPSCHEVQGYMPGRLEFETEYFNEAEEAVQHMQFDPGDGINPRTKEVEPEMELKMTIMEIYNSRLDARVERKKIIFEHQLLEYRKNQLADKKKTKEEKDLLNKAKPFARMMQHEDFDTFCKGLEYEHNLRQAISQLQEWRNMQITNLRAGEKYESEKQQRQSRAPPLGQFDRLASSRIGKPIPPFEQPSAATALLSSDLPLHIKEKSGLTTPPPDGAPNGTNGVPTPQHSKTKFVPKQLPNTVPLKFGKESAADLQLLTKEERELCSVLRIMPKPYLALKEMVVRAALNNSGSLKKKTAREICKIDANKSTQLFDFFVHSGWIARA